MVSTTKKKVAVIFGAKSPEHDVSIVTGLQALKAIDITQFEVFPVYIAPNGEWLIGQELLSTANYMLSSQFINKLDNVTIDLGFNLNNKGKLLFKKNKLFRNKKSIEFDIALLALHGIHSEDGQIAAIMEIANVPYTGMRHFASTLVMNKIATKQVLKSVGIPVLPDNIIVRPTNGFVLDIVELEQIVSKITFPVCVKPCNLGSSIGVAKANNKEELVAVLPNIFKYDEVAVIEPFVENLVEYNIAVGCINNKIVTSAIEKPKCVQDLLDFKQKYASNNGQNSNKLGSKSSVSSSGMLSMTRELNPQLDQNLERNLRNWAELAFKTVYGSGFPRIDFLCNSKTGEIWLNEINPCPGSFGFYLWEASKHNILFTELLNILLSEAEVLHSRQQLPMDPTPVDARLFPRK